MDTLTHTQDILPRLRSANAEPKCGDIIDNKIRLEHKIGERGLGALFEATHKSLLIPVAVKILRLTFSTEVDIKRFEKEAQTLAELNHPNIVKIYDAGKMGDKFNYLVTELLEGQSLEDWMTHPRHHNLVEMNEVVQYLGAVCNAVTCAHEQKIIHRDIKPGNIFLHEERDGSTTPKILDFGLAKDLDADLDITQTGFIPGTTEFIAPEILKGSPPSPQSDVYSLGVVLYEAITGRRLFDTENHEAILSLVLDESYVPTLPTDANERVPKALGAVCQKAIARNVQDRYQTVTQFQTALAALNILPSDQYSSGTTPKRSLWIHGGYLVTIILLLGVIFWKQPEPTIIPLTSPAPVAEPSSETAEAMTPASSPIPSVVDMPDISLPLLGVVPPEESPENTTVSIARITTNIADTNSRIKDAQSRAIQKTLSPKEFADLAWTAFQRDEYSEAIRLYNESLKSKNNPKWRLQLGQAYLASGNKAIANTQWQRVLKNTSPGDKFYVAAKELLENNGVHVE